MSTCDVKTGTCAPEASERCETKCPCGTDCGGDPTACAMNLWTGSFFGAMKALQVEILKEKIRKSWGPKMEKAADVILEAMESQWRSMLAASQAKTDVRSKLQALWREK